MAGAPLSNYLSVWTSSAYYYNTSGVIQYPASVQKMASSYPVPIYSDTSERLNQLTAYYLNTDIASGTRVNGNARNVIATITPVDTQVGMIFSKSVCLSTSLIKRPSGSRIRMATLRISLMLDKTTILRVGVSGLLSRRWINSFFLAYMYRKWSLWVCHRISLIISLSQNLILRK